MPRENRIQRNAWQGRAEAHDWEQRNAQMNLSATDIEPAVHRAIDFLARARLPGGK